MHVQAVNQPSHIESLISDSLVFHYCMVVWVKQLFGVFSKRLTVVKVSAPAEMSYRNIDKRIRRLILFVYITWEEI